MNRRKKYFTTKVYLKPEQWDEKKLLIRNHPNADFLNRYIYDFMYSLEKKELELWQQGRLITLELLKEYIEGRKCRTSFTQFFKKEIEESSLKRSTRKNHFSTFMALEKYKKEVSFEELNFEFVVAFEHFLHSMGYHINTIAKHMKHMKRYVNIAINKEYMDWQHYPFRKYHIKTVESKHTHLAPEELELLELFGRNGKAGRYQKTLDAFLFCCYAGMRYSDFVSLTSKNIVEINQTTWLIYRSVKTNIEVHLPLYLLFNGKAVDMLTKYSHELDSFFRLRDNSNINKELKMIALQAGLNKNISFHTARHTNATLLIYSGVNITTVQKLLGHKSVKTTQIYTSIMDMTVVHDLEKNFPLL